MEFRIAIVAAVFNRDVVGVMIEAAEDEIKKRQGAVVHTVEVTGSYELPLVADTLLARSDVDAVVVLGFIERGETLHGEVMGHAVHRSLLASQLSHRKPLGFGIIGPGAVEQQAHERKESYARAAVAAAVQSLRVLRDIAD